jgi:hypothetical protein
VYSGRIDDRFSQLGRQKERATTHEFVEAIQAALAGTPLPHPRVPAIGCRIADLR